MLKDGFNLRKWQSNDKVVQVEIDRLESLRGATNNEIQGNSKGTLGVPNSIEGANKVLGVIWESDDDTLQLCSVAYAERTQRETCSSFDSLITTKSFHKLQHV